MKKITIFLVISFFWFLNYGQIVDGTMPISFDKQNLKATVPILKMPAFDVNQMLQEDEINIKEKKPIPYRFAKRFRVFL